MMKFYELSYLYSCFNEVDEIQEFINRIKLIIENEKGVFHQYSAPVKRKLAYEIDKNQFAYLGTIEFDLESDKTKILKEQLKNDHNLLRFVVFKKKKLIQKTVINYIKNRGNKENKEKIFKLTQKKSLDEKQDFTKFQKIKIDDIGKKLDEILD